MANYNIFLKKGSCSLCNNVIVIQRRYSGENLCTECFQKNIEKNIYKTISKYKMFNPDDKIIVGLSGGKDSIALLYNLLIMQKRKFKSESIIALTIDEGIKDYRENSINKAKQFCKKYDIELKIISFKEKTGLSLDDIVNIKKGATDSKYSCNYCAAIRRRLLNEGAKELGGTVLAMGHNLTDLAETYLMNILFKRHNLIARQYLFKQENIEIRSFYVRKVMPLLRIPEEEVFLYSNIKKFDYYPSHCLYREKDPIIRKRVLNFIQEFKKYSPEIEFNLLSGFLELSQILYNQNQKVYDNTCKVCGYPCGNGKICTYCSYLKDFSQ